MAVQGVRAELLVRTPSGIVYLGHQYAGESGQFRPLIFLGRVRSGAGFLRTPLTFEITTYRLIVCGCCGLFTEKIDSGL